MDFIQFLEDSITTVALVAVIWFLAYEFAKSMSDEP